MFGRLSRRAARRRIVDKVRAGRELDGAGRLLMSPRSTRLAAARIGLLLPRPSTA
jgi:hypothetical protein